MKRSILNLLDELRARAKKNRQRSGELLAKIRGEVA